MERHRVHVAGDGLAFAAAHFITYEDGACEPLHGHNYRVEVEVEAPLNEAGYVVDFVGLRERVGGILAELDHRVLLPGRSPRIEVAEGDGEVAVRCGERSYRFPAGDVRVLPVGNTTAEAVAGWLADRLLSAPEGGDGGLLPSGEPPSRIVVRVEESPGLTAVCVRGPGED